MGMRLAGGVLAALLLASSVPAGEVEKAGLRFSVPKGWETVRASSPLVLAEFRIPHVRKDRDDGQLVLFQFEDTKKGGRLSDAVERWYAQVTPADGRAAKDAATETTREVNGLHVRVVDVSGTYRQMMGPMPQVAKPDYRLLGAVVEGASRHWYWRAVGPAKTMADARGKFDDLIGSLAAAP